MDSKHVYLQRHSIVIVFLLFFTLKEVKSRFPDDPNYKYSNWTFKDYLMKYDPRRVWDKIDKLKKSGKKLSPQQEVDLFMRGIDMTDDFLKLEVKNGDPKVLVIKDGRRFKPPKGLSKYFRDRFDIRQRFYELMKQAIYQARNKMVIMQILRAKYKHKSLYKMGFLMSKTDSACRTFSKFAFREFRGCILGKQDVIKRHKIFDILTSEERTLNLWFTVELLVDLVRKNDYNCKKVLADEKIKDKRGGWKFVN